MNMDKNNKKPIHELLVYRLRFFNRVFVIIAIFQKRKYHLCETVLLCFDRLRAIDIIMRSKSFITYSSILKSSKPCNSLTYWNEILPKSNEGLLSKLISKFISGEASKLISGRSIS